MNTYKDLKDFLSNTTHTTEDSALLSPAYYYITGRRGLYLFQDGESFAFACEHPNLDKHILIFKGVGEHADHLTHRAALHFSTSGKQVTFARHTVSDFDPDGQNQDDRAYHPPSPETEKHMDWLYPVHTISTEDVAELKGGQFKTARKHCSRAEKNLLSYTTLGCLTEAGRQAFFKCFENKDNAVAQKMIAQDEDYYRCVFELLENHSDDFDAMIFFKDNEIVGITAWEKEPHGGAALSLMNVADTRIYGLSTYMTVKNCQLLQESGIERLNLGGAETEGLDNYNRRTFNPVQSLQLYSASIEYKGSGLKTTPANQNSKDQNTAKKGFIPRKNSLP